MIQLQVLACYAAMPAGWKDSQKVFTDALAQMVMADSSVYASEQPEQQLQSQPSSRRLLASALRSTGNAQDAAETAAHSKLVMPSLTASSDESSAGLADSASAAYSSSNDDDVQSTAHTAVGEDSINLSETISPEAIVSVVADPQRCNGSTCQADEASTVCADKVQPVLMPQPWEQDQESANQGLTLQQCQLLNASVCEPSVQMSKKGQGFMVVVYNALAWERATEPVRVPLDVTAGSAAHWVVTGQPCLTVLAMCRTAHGVYDA